MVNLKEQRSELPLVPSEESCRGRTYVVTGANTGLGFECAQHLVRLKAQKVILACRSLERGKAAQKRMEENTGRTGVAEVWQLDVGSYESVKAFASRFDTLDRVDAVIENASVAMLEYKEAEGLESSLTINVIGTFLLAALLLPKLQRSAKAFGVKSHLVVVGSEVAFDVKGHLEKVNGDLLDGLDKQAKTSMANRYQTTKLLQLYAVREFAKRQSQSGGNVIINIVNPGLCKTELSRNVGPLLQAAFTAVKFLIARTAEMGSRTLLHAAFAEPESHGKYLSACKIQEDTVPDWVTNSAGQATQQRVWESLSSKLESIQPGCIKTSLPV